MEAQGRRAAGHSWTLKRRGSSSHRIGLQSVGGKVVKVGDVCRAHAVSDLWPEPRCGLRRTCERQGRGEAGRCAPQVWRRLVQAYRWGAATHADGGWAGGLQMALCAKSDEADCLAPGCPRAQRTRLQGLRSTPGGCRRCRGLAAVAIDKNTPAGRTRARGSRSSAARRARVGAGCAAPRGQAALARRRRAWGRVRGCEGARV